MASEYTVEKMPGVGPTTAKKLADAGYGTVESLAVATVHELVDIGVGPDVASRLTRTAREMAHVELVTADDVLKRRLLAKKITTGCRELDSILGGGIETQSITELVGEFAVGKTQLCHALCVTVQLPIDKGGMEGSALYIDTEGTFRPERIMSMARAKGLDVEKSLRNIIYARAYNSDHQILVADKAWEVCPGNNIKLIIVDSLTSHFRSEYIGRENLAPRQQKLNSHVHKLLRLAEALNVAVVVTNQVVADPGQFFGDPNKPAGGHVVAHASTYRVFIRKGKEHTKVARLFDAPHLPYREAIFVVTENGIEDSKEKD